MYDVTFMHCLFHMSVLVKQMRVAARERGRERERGWLTANPILSAKLVKPVSYVMLSKIR